MGNLTHFFMRNLTQFRDFHCARMKLPDGSEIFRQLKIKGVGDPR